MYSLSAGHVRMKSPFNATNAYTSSVRHAKSGICCGPESVRYVAVVSKPLKRSSWFFLHRVQSAYPALSYRNSGTFRNKALLFRN